MQLCGAHVVPACCACSYAATQLLQCGASSCGSIAQVGQNEKCVHMTSRQNKRHHFEFYSEPIRRASVGLTRGWVVDNLNCHGTTTLTL